MFSPMLLALILSPSTEKNKHSRSRIWKAKSGNLTGYNRTISCGFLLFVVYELVFAHLVSLIPLLGFIHGFPFLYVFYCEVAELFVISRDYQGKRVNPPYRSSNYGNPS